MSKGNTIALKAEGPDEIEAVDALCQLLDCLA
jgi:phosphotransferase system HPr-like phosphotransfer protein